eukprot:INCI6291.1.p1 GENE.INCI6291.1~~INCI6291.1.p1  ORF type:complete len:514 (+),score=73.74 INCI6291.1:51-1544(+)
MGTPDDDKPTHSSCHRRFRPVQVLGLLLVVFCFAGWVALSLRNCSDAQEFAAGEGSGEFSSLGIGGSPDDFVRRLRRVGSSKSTQLCQRGSWSFSAGYGNKLLDMERKLILAERQLQERAAKLLQQAQANSEAPAGGGSSETLAHETVKDGLGTENEAVVYMPAITAVWEPAPQCAHKLFNAVQAAMCLAERRRIVWLGDSVLRGMFWDIVEFFESGLPRDLYRVHIVKRFENEQGQFTNFEDQDMVVVDTKTHEEVFSIRFTYVSNAVDFSTRCELIHDWFFQCLDDTRTIMDRVLDEELERSRSDRYATSSGEKPIGVLYWNTGLWDWRTGVPTHEFFEAMRSIVTTTTPTADERSEGWTGYKRAAIFDASEQVIWRASTASWPTKFASAKECVLKPNNDPRPCKIHTQGLLEYNLAVKDLMLSAGFSIVDPWEVTSTRPDASEDGLHFGECSRQRKLAEASGSPPPSLDKNRACIYRVVNQMFFNAVCTTRTPH